jgi:hypothetical protein
VQILVCDEANYIFVLTNTGVTNILAVISNPRKTERVGFGKEGFQNELFELTFETGEQKYVGETGSPLLRQRCCIYALTTPPSGRLELILVMAHGQKGKEKEEDHLASGTEGCKESLLNMKYVKRPMKGDAYINRSSR